MLIVNTSYHVEESIEQAWMEWVIKEYIPQVVAPGLLISPRFHRLLVENEPGFQSYALQFEVKDLDTLDLWFQKYGSVMQKTLSELYQEKVLGFTTMMETIEID